jgi:hypothetical protein
MTTTFTLTGGLSYTYRSNQGNNQDKSFQMHLPNGRKVELCSKEGADDFVDTFGTDFISTNLTRADDQELSTAYLATYVVMADISDNASPEKIASGIPESELRTFVEHTRYTLETLSTDRNWLCSGIVSAGHELLLRAVTSFSKHPLFLKIFLSNQGMEAVAKFYASRKKHDTPSQCVAGSIQRLVADAYLILTQEGVSLEKVFGIIEKTGLLGHFIRCVRVDPEPLVIIVPALQSCVQLVKKKLKSGTRTGDILDAVIAGEDGPISEKAKSSLEGLQTLARLSNNNDNYDNKCCHYCEKLETQMDNSLLMKCQRCKAAYYCSKDCQVADWKTHKKYCDKLNSGVVSRSTLKTSQNTLWAFIKSNYFDIAKEVYKKTQEYNVPKKELLVEIDFYAYEDAPALRNEFKVWLTSAFFEGPSVADAPDWFHTDTDKKTVARYVRLNYERVKSDDLLTVCRAGNGMVTVQNLCLPVASTGCELLSDEAVESIGREDYVRMVACLGQVVTNMYFEKRSGLTWRRSHERDPY